MQTENIITLEMVEALAASLEKEQESKRAKLARLISAYARIIEIREPAKFSRSPKQLTSEDDGNGSFPPSEQWSDWSGPRLIKIESPVTSDTRTEPGFYYNWERTTDHPGLFVSPNGEIWGADETGSGCFGQFPAHPGDCNVDVIRRYFCRCEVAMEELEKAEAHLREIAFPAASELQ